jgi:hypothetical protein
MNLSIRKPVIVAYGVYFELGVKLVRETSESSVAICIV